MITLSLASQPVGAKVTDSDGRTLGLTPYRVQIPRGGEQRIWFRKAGYRVVERRFSADSDATIAVQLERERAKTRQAMSGSPAPSETRPPLDSPTGTIDPFAR